MPVQFLRISMNKTYLVTGVVAFLIVFGAFVVFRNPANAPSDTVTPSVSTSISPDTSPTGSTGVQNIIITTPTANSVVTNPITVTGRARVFEGSFQYALRDTSGKIWYQATGQTGAPENGNYQPFTVKIPITVGAPSDLIIEVFEYSARDGAIVNLVRVPVRLTNQQTATVKVFLNNRRLNTNDSCDVVFPVTRTILKTQETAYLALYELLLGPVGPEKDQYHTSIPEGVKINSLRITNGTAYADFNSQLEYQVGGSCRVLNIRTQITNTLKQFSSVKNVIISIEGRTEDILQP